MCDIHLPTPPNSIFQLFPEQIFSAPLLPIPATTPGTPAQPLPPQKLIKKKLWAELGKRFSSVSPNSKNLNGWWWGNV